MIYDVFIVGGGPAGLYAAFYAGLRDLSVALIEADQELGGRLRYYPEKLVWDLGGLPPTRGETLRAQLEAQARTFAPKVILGQKITGLSPVGPLWHLTDGQGHQYRARTVILAVGAGTLGTRRLEVPGARDAEGRGLSYSLRNPEDYRDRDVVISGGGNSAVDWAHQLVGIASRVTLVHRRQEFRAHETVVNNLASAGVEVRVPWAVTRVETLPGRVLSLEMKDANGSGVEFLKVDALLVGHGLDFSAKTELLGEVSAPGVFACGDCVRRQGKTYLMASTFPEAAEAVNAAKLWLDPAADAQAMVSSHHPALV